MLISHRKKFIYTKTAKTGGTSVEVYFEPYCMAEGEWTFSHAREEYVGPSGIVGYRGTDFRGKLWYNHLSAKQIRKQIGDKIWTEYFKFCVVRNPFDKMVSAFHFFEANQRGGQPAPANQPVDVPALARRFHEWLKLGKMSHDRDKYLIDGKICIDYFIRYEEMDKGMRHACDVLGIPFEPAKLPHLKGGLRPAGVQLVDYYDAKAIDHVAAEYRFELDHFGYTPPTRAAAA